MMTFDQWMLRVHELLKERGINSGWERQWEMNYWRFKYSEGVSPEEATK